VKNELNDDFDVNLCYDFMFLVVLIAFERMLTNKQVWGSNLGQRDIKIRVFDEKLDGFLRGNARTGCTCLVKLACAVASCSVQKPMILVFSGTWGSFGLS
jgi:hypothetical protein